MLTPGAPALDITDETSRYEAERCATAPAAAGVWGSSRAVALAIAQKRSAAKSHDLSADLVMLDTPVMVMAAGMHDTAARRSFRRRSCPPSGPTFGQHGCAAKPHGLLRNGKGEGEWSQWMGPVAMNPAQ